MAASLNFTTQPPELCMRRSSFKSKLSTQKRPNFVSFAVNSTEPSSPEPEKPQIELEFIAVQCTILKHTAYVSFLDCI